MVLVYDDAIRIQWVPEHFKSQYPKNHRMGNVWTGPYPFDRTKSQSNQSIDLLRTCKLVHVEATPILYGANRFKFADDYYFTAFIGVIGKSARHIRYISFGRFFNKSTTISALSRVKACEALVKLQLPVSSMRGWYSAYDSPTKYAELLKGSLKALKKSKARQGNDFSLESIVEIVGLSTDATAAEDFSKQLKKDLKKLLE